MGLDRLGEVTAERFRKKYPDGALFLGLDGAIQVLADENYLSEALYNLITNGWEATLEAGRKDPVELLSHQERLYTVLEVRDRAPVFHLLTSSISLSPFTPGKTPISTGAWGCTCAHISCAAI